MDPDYRAIICVMKNDEDGQRAVSRLVTDALIHEVALTIRPAGNEIGVFMADPPRSFAIFNAICGVLKGTQ